ncbi:MAG: hypothetical protein Q7K43_06125 [Candidatus Woesearchaeota archaeon]|nr:hypothetical protein [Candidatus Woesearchaeota archaeon]
MNQSDATIKKVFLDADFLVFCSQNKIDYASELRRLLNVNFKMCILDKTLDELEVVASKSAKNSTAVRLAKTILTKQKIELIATDKRTNTDGLILIRKEVHAVCTQDKKFKSLLKARNIFVLTARKAKYIAME